MVDILILAIIAGYCLWIIMQRYRKKKKASKKGCTGSCAGCSACSDFSYLKDIYDAKKKEDIHNG